MVLVKGSRKCATAGLLCRQLRRCKRLYKVNSVVPSVTRVVSLKYERYCLRYRSCDFGLAAAGRQDVGQGRQVRETALLCGRSPETSGLLREYSPLMIDRETVQ